MSPKERRGSAGGRARAANLSAERKTEIARDAYLAGAVNTVAKRAEALTSEQVGRLSDALNARIDRWVAEQLVTPWPLNSAQLTLVRRALVSQEATRQ